MCGFFGNIYNKKHFFNKKKFIKSAQFLEHRGPDDKSSFYNDNLALIFYRLSIRDITTKICKMLDKNFNDIVIDSEERLGKDQSYFLDSKKLRECFSWSYQISLEDGLYDTLEWIKENYSLLKNLPGEYQHKL